MRGDTDTRGQPSLWEPPPRAGRGRFKGRGPRRGGTTQKGFLRCPSPWCRVARGPLALSVPPHTHTPPRDPPHDRSPELPEPRGAPPPQVSPPCHPPVPPAAPRTSGCPAKPPLAPFFPRTRRGGLSAASPLLQLGGEGAGFPPQPPLDGIPLPPLCRAVWGGGRAGRGVQEGLF